jgi:hypothetical protein
VVGGPAFPSYYGRMMLRLGKPVFSQGYVPPPGAVLPHSIILDPGDFFYQEDLEKSWNFGPQAYVFAPTICSVPGAGILALWNRGTYEPNDGTRTSRIWGSVVPGSHREGQAIETFGFEWTSHTNDRFNANLHDFECAIPVEETNGTEMWIRTVGLVNSNANGQINIRIFDMRSGKFDPSRIYSSEWSPAPGFDPAGNSGGGHPIVTWIGRDDGDVHVVIAQPRARLSAGIGSVFTFGTPLVANQPGDRRNRRPSVASFVVPGLGGGLFFVVAWEALRTEAKPRPYSDIKARVFDYSGRPYTDEFTLSSPHFAARAAPHVFPIDGGGIYVVWMDDSDVPDSPSPQPPVGRWRIKGRRWAFDVI